MAVNYKTEQGVAVIEMNNPPANALSMELRRGIVDSLDKALLDPQIKGIVITGNAKFFSAGADITEFNTPKANMAPNLRQLIEILEKSRKPVCAAISGNCLGGGFELALGCHFRVAKKDATVGLPEVKIGLLPGGGGTQRLPRAVGLPKALEMILQGKFQRAEKLPKLFSALVDDDVVAAGIKVVLENADNKPWPHLRAQEPAGKVMYKEMYNQAKTMLENDKRSKHMPAPKLCLEAVIGSCTLPFPEGLKRERDLFNQLVMSPESQALRHIFFSERQALKVPDIDADTKPRDIKKVGVVGAGTMGGGITMNFLSKGIPVIIAETKQEALDRGLGIIRKNYENTAKKGRITFEQVDKNLSLLSTTLDLKDLADCDLIIEAVFEEMSVKQTIFENLDKIAKKGAILASNTSTLDINKIASFTQRPEDVVGMHFFSPANVMKLLEVVRGDKTAPDVLVTALQIGKYIGKQPVVSGVCDGFIGNRMLAKYREASEQIMMAGATPKEIDTALEKFGFAMGPFRVGDLAGLDIGWAIRKRQRQENPEANIPESVSDRICEKGRFGQKTGRGWYIYEQGNRTPIEDPEVLALIDEFRQKQGITPRKFSDQEIVDRCVYALVSEGAKILEEGIAARASDIDVVYIYGYGFPAHTGGPMNYAQQVGLYNVERSMKWFAHDDPEHADFWKVPKLIQEHAQSGKPLK
ncbi:3-hydroxyacyl-CoA dehydrogenase NAD-binding domain-containing protein [Brackiella oedipodis]|uniref:3-hydroxyacyl-CoA dehydrogenase NAD-binding domain-containing protein n=1 Tax=Brackiella oedipodis TaxID=124225 RepID=UPI000490E336|nr:3-hydroxyacyl-CoA dehydrogenase NAD-binding domain-containing protein [Brackiella oedipodis]